MWGDGDDGCWLGGVVMPSNERSDQQLFIFFSCVQPTLSVRTVMEQFLVKMKFPAASTSVGHAAMTSPPPPTTPTPLSVRIHEQQQLEAQALQSDTSSHTSMRHLTERLERTRREAEEAIAREHEERNRAETPPPAPLPRNADGSVSTAWEPNEIRHRVMYVEDDESGVIPKSTHELCMWDMQPFRGVPFPIPIRFDARENAFWVRGWACSLSCALAYIDHNHDTVFSDTGYNMIRNTIMMARDYYGAAFSSRLTLRAPPREKLSMLYAKFVQQGAAEPMVEALSEFRNGSEDIIYHAHPAPPFIRVTQRYDEEVLRKRREDEHQQRLESMNQKPLPIACTKRGMVEQRKYVLKRRRDGDVAKKRGTLDSILGV